MTPFQLDASAKAPCTSTIVGLASACWDGWSVVVTGNLLWCGCRRVNIALGRGTPRSSFDELLAAVDVEGRTGDRGVRHEVDGQRGDVGRADDAADRQRGAELRSALVDLVAEQRGRHGRVDKACRDQV